MTPTSQPTSETRRPRRALPAILVALTIVLTLLGTTVTSADAQTERRAQPLHQVEDLRLACQATNIGGERGVACRWSEATNERTRGYKLLKITNGEPRELVTTVGADGRLGFFDTDVVAPSTVTYGVVAVNRVGRVIGVSAPQTVNFGSLGR